MTYKILKANGEFVCRSTVRHLTPDELDSDVHQEKHCIFDAGIEEKLGKATTQHDFDPENLTPDHDYYKDGVEGKPDAPPEDMPPTPVFNDHYIGAVLILSCDGTLTRGRGTSLDNMTLTPSETHASIM